MTNKNKETFAAFVILCLIVLGCNNFGKRDTASNPVANSSTATNKSSTTAANRPPTTSSEDSGYSQSQPAPSDKSVPAPEAGNAQVWGQVLYNSQPVEKIEVKLCQTLNSFTMQCGGKTFRTETDKDGVFLMQKVPPMEYQGLTVKVFTSNFYVFEASMAGMPKKYKLEADKTFFVTPTNLFKGDLKALSPKAGSKTNSANLELKWQEYPDADYYKMSLIWSGKDYKTSPYVSERVDGTTFTIDKPIDDGQYWFQLEAFNDKDVKIAQSDRTYKITLTGGTANAASANK